jgi:hypothetical protein
VLVAFINHLTKKEIKVACKIIEQYTFQVVSQLQAVLVVVLWYTIHVLPQLFRELSTSSTVRDNLDKLGRARIIKMH